MKGKKRHDFFYSLLWVIFHRSLTRRFNYKFDKIEITDTPYIVVSNHLTNWDPILIGLSFRKPMYYVASDHILRKGLGKFLQYAISPISRVKTANETQTVISIFRRLKENCNICIFAEGSTSFDGETGEIQPSIGKLVKRAGVCLITYKFTGAYFTFPRWARFFRRGEMHGRLVQMYSPGKIASMTEDEIYKSIIKDIHVNAYEIQESNPVAYKGKKRAEYLETALYCCPECKQFGTLKSRDDTLFCACGFNVRYNEYCRFEIPDSESPPPLKTIIEWVKWEREEIGKAAISNNLTVPVFADENQKLFEIKKSNTNVLIAVGKLCMYGNRLSVDMKEFLIDDIIDMSVITMKTIIFAVKNAVYEIHSKNPRSALKYVDMYKAVKSLKKTDNAANAAFIRSK